MKVKARAVRAELKAIRFLRELFLQESNFQIRYDACHERGWTDSYLLTVDDVEVGYGSVKGQAVADRDTVFEFYVLPSFRKLSSAMFSELLAASGAHYIECQTNDLLLSAMLYEFAANLHSDVVLFEDHTVTGHMVSNTVFRPRRDDDQVFVHEVEPAGDHVLARDGEVVATGGFMLHYNKPFADLYMEVRSDCQRQGCGSFILQELKKACYLAGRVPAARCRLDNRASRAALLKAGMRVCGFMLIGEVTSLDRDPHGG